MSNEYDAGMGTTPGMWEMVSDALDGEKLTDSVNAAIYALVEGKAEVREKSDDARRVDACLKLCADVPDEILYSGKSLTKIAFDVSHEATAKLRAQRDELLALLIESQTSVGGDWRARRDAAIAKATDPWPLG